MHNTITQCIKRSLAVSFLCFAFITTADAAGAKPDVLLADVYHDEIDVTQYLVSEKYDGVRAVWNGQTLRTRQGRLIHAPAWFTAGFPEMALDGELWIKRGAFDQVSGIVRTKQPDDKKWRQINYLVFELPNAQGDFSARYSNILHAIKKANIKHLKAVKQFKIKSHQQLNQKLKAIVAAGGEGLMLHRADAFYETGRSSALLKLKPYFDAEATVIAHLPGRGKYTGKMGSLLVELADGVQFKLGTGFTDVQRENPPAIGSVVTFAYQQKTKTGKPRFARFLRIRTPTK